MGFVRGFYWAASLPKINSYSHTATSFLIYNSIKRYILNYETAMYTLYKPVVVLNPTFSAIQITYN